MSALDQVKAAFADRVTIDGATSLHPYSTVWRATVHAEEGDVAAVVKRTWSRRQPQLETWQRALLADGVRTVAPLVPPVTIEAQTDDGLELQTWVAYPELAGRPWDGSTSDLAHAGTLLGDMHRASEGLDIEGFPDFDWGSDAADSIAEDIEAVEASAAEHWQGADPSRWVDQLRAFPGMLHEMRQAPMAMPASVDHRASNLLFDDEGAAIVDLENASMAPRIFDLAVAVLLFPLEHEGSQGRALSRDEWLEFLDAYLERAPRLGDLERSMWPAAMTYMKLEWGTWHLTEGVERDPANLAYLQDLLTLDEGERYALP